MAESPTITATTVGGCYETATPGSSVATNAFVVDETNVCVITLNTAGRGNCALAARQLKAGSYTFAAGYGGSTDFRAATSPAKLSRSRSIQG